MTISEFQIQLDISLGNELEVLKQHAHETSYGYLFIDSSDGQCYLFDKHGKIDDISKVKSIGEWVFCNCTSLKSIVIPDSAESIGDNAFESCAYIENIIIPDSVESIGNYAFANCSSLKSIIISNSIKSIGDYAFWDCTSLKEVIFKGKTMDQVNTMNKYSWGVKDTSIIKCR